MVYIEITESTPPKTKVTRYGEGGSETLADLQKKYLEDGYILYRLKKQYSVSYTHDCAVPIDGDYCEDCAALTKPVISAVEQTGDGALKLSWDKVEYADAYGILRSDDSGSGFAWVGTAWELSYTDEDVRAGDTYQYQVFPMRYINGVWVSGPHSDTTELPCMEGAGETDHYGFGRCADDILAGSGECRRLWDRAGRGAGRPLCLARFSGHNQLYG